MDTNRELTHLCRPNWIISRSSCAPDATPACASTSSSSRPMTSRVRRSFFLDRRRITCGRARFGLGGGLVRNAVWFWKLLSVLQMSGPRSSTCHGAFCVERSFLFDRSTFTCANARKETLLFADRSQHLDSANGLCTPLSDLHVRCTVPNVAQEKRFKKWRLMRHSSSAPSCLPKHVSL